MRTYLFISASFLLLALISCKKDKVEPFDIASKINAFPSEPLNNEELNSLLIMREEEKLAYDVYINFYNKYGENAFKNIASSEQTHTDAVNVLLKKYNLSDPVGSHTLGVFTDSTLQSLFNQLIAKGDSSLLQAYEVGVTIEDMDINDLNNYLVNVDNQDIKYVYDNLNLGSRNHLRTYYSKLLGLGGVYTAKYITQIQFDAIINSPKETGDW